MSFIFHKLERVSTKYWRRWNAWGPGVTSIFPGVGPVAACIQMFTPADVFVILITQSVARAPWLHWSVAVAILLTIWVLNSNVNLTRRKTEYKQSARNESIGRRNYAKSHMQVQVKFQCEYKGSVSEYIFKVLWRSDINPKKLNGA